MIAKDDNPISTVYPIKFFYGIMVKATKVRLCAVSKRKQSRTEQNKNTNKPIRFQFTENEKFSNCGNDDRGSERK